jgi:hypothetical protein
MPKSAICWHRLDRPPDLPRLPGLSAIRAESALGGIMRVHAEKSHSDRPNRYQFIVASVKNTVYFHMLAKIFAGLAERFHFCVDFTMLAYNNNRTK